MDNQGNWVATKGRKGKIKFKYLSEQDGAQYNINKESRPGGILDYLEGNNPSNIIKL